MPNSALPLHSRPEWVQNIVHRFRSDYRREDGLLMISVLPDGRPHRKVPVIADFGDILPFLEELGESHVVDEQLRLSKPHLWNGLYQRDGRVRLFLNHDWLLGLLELARQRGGDPELVRMVRTASHALHDQFQRDGFLIDELPRGGSVSSWLLPASPFNGGYIELWVEEAAMTGEETPLHWASRLGAAWIETETFQRFGVFEPRHSVRFPWIQPLRRQLSSMRARLFKDNTNLVWGLLTLSQATGESRWRFAVDHWLDGFAGSFFGSGLPFAHLDRSAVGYDRTLKAAFSALDLLVDLHDAGVGDGRALDLAWEIASEWMGLQWPNGLFPVSPGADYDHLDANVDLAVAFVKLAALGVSESDRLAEAADRCRRAVLENHAAPAGYVLSVDRYGRHHDDRILVKYQALITKLALLPDDPADLVGDVSLLSLLRDR